MCVCVCVLDSDPRLRSRIQSDGLADRVTVRKSFEWNFSRILRMAFVGVSQ